MQYVNIFLASSIVEFDYERQAIGNFIRSLNDMYSPKGIYFKLHMCEDMSEAISEGRKQNEYNEKARNCDFFFMLIHRKAGKFTLEEFEEALSSYLHNREEKKENKPLIIAFVKPLSDSEEENEVQSFLDRYCTELQQYPSIFDGVDTIKLKMLLHLERSMGSSMELSFCDSKLLIGGNELDCVHLANVPMYSNSEAISNLREETETLEAEISAIRSGEGEESSVYRAKMRMLERTKNELRTLENQLVNAAKNIASYLSSGRGVTERAKQAAALLDEGRTEEAIAILDDTLRRSELRSAEENADRALAAAADALSEVQKLVDEALIKIEAIRMCPLTKERAEEMIALYREAEAPIVKYNFDRAPLIAFAVLLREQNKYKEATEEAEALYEYYMSRNDAPARQRAEVCDILARLYYVSRGDSFTRAEGLYLEAIRLSEEINDLYEVSFVTNNLGYFYKATCRYDEAKKAFSRSCEIREKLSEENPSLRSKHAWSMNSLADVYVETGEYKAAIELYEKALEIRREEAAKSSNELTYVARTCHNLSIPHLKLNDLENAYKYASEALSIRRTLALINPDVHNGLAAQSCISLADYYIASSKELDRAHLLLDEGERYLEACKDAFLPERKADLYIARGNLADREGLSSKEYYRMALDLRKERAKNGAIASYVEAAEDALALSRSLIKEGKGNEALPLLEEAKETFVKYLAYNPIIYGALLSECESELNKLG
ncbi:MAG: tetratricopeptide repeat protein [Clostridia bacterium]|nr:tetratricopeptide repeat protein [Clostridia bacterium]